MKIDFNSLPPGWQSATLETIAAPVKNAIVDGPFGSNLKLSDYVSDGVPVLQGKNITGNIFVWTGIRFITPEKASQLARSKVVVGDILIVKIGSIGYSAIIDDLHGYPFAIIPANLAKLSPDRTKINPKFLVYYLASNKIRSELIKRSSKTAQPALSLSRIKSLPIPLPPLAEQERIVCLLDEAEVLRKLRAQANSRMEEFVPALFHEIFGDPQENQNLWDRVKLKDLMIEGDKVNYGVVQPGGEFPGGIPIVRVGDFANMQISLENMKRIAPSIEENYKRSRLQGDEVLIACVGSIGEIALADARLKGFNIVRAVARVRPNNRLDRHFLAYYFKTPFVQDYFRNATRTVNQPTLNIKQIEETIVMLPPLSLQHEFARRVQEAREIQSRQAQSAERIEALYQSMLSRAFAGEL